MKIKNLIFIAMFISFTSASLFAVDLTKKPEPLEDIDYQFPEYEERTLENGLKIFVIEDHEQPTVSMSISFAGGSSIEFIAGTAEMAASMLTKGTKNRTALEIAQEMDGLGLGIGGSASDDRFYVSTGGLKKHIDVMLNMMSDVVLNPTFPAEELEKLKTQAIAGIEYEKSNANSLAAKLSRIVIYGKHHPYAKYNTKESIEKIDQTIIKNYYSMVAVPNNAVMAIIGDVKADEVIPKIEKAFLSWTKGTKPNVNLPEPKLMSKGVYFVERPASVQSSMMLVAPTVERKNEDYVKLDLTADIMGSGFSGRINRVIREKYAFSYGGSGYQTSTKYANRAVFMASVAKEKTDSSVMVMLDLLKDLRENPPKDEEINRIKNYQIGNYLMGFESSNFISSLITQSEFYDIPIEEIIEYPERYKSTSAKEVSKIASKYLNEDNLRIVIVGDPSLKEELSKYGEVFAYDVDMLPIKKAETISMTLEELMNKYVEALGGEKAIASINSVIEKANVSLSAGPQTMQGKLTKKTKVGNKLFESLDLGMMKQERWFNSDKGWTSQNGQKQEMPEEQIADQKFESELFSYTKFDEYNYNLKIEGKKGNHIVLEFSSPTGDAGKIYYNADNYLIEKVFQTSMTPNGPMNTTIEFMNYVEINGVMMPKEKKIVQGGALTIMLESEYELNKEISDSEFTPQG